MELLLGADPALWGRRVDDERYVLVSLDGAGMARRVAEVMSGKAHPDRAGVYVDRLLIIRDLAARRTAEEV